MADFVADEGHATEGTDDEPAHIHWFTDIELRRI
jgi:hypothetical protein